jgi:two-component system, NtrC family, sensor kinase
MKQVVILWFVLLLGFATSTAQNKQIDSLKQQLVSAKEDTNKVWILQNLSGSYTWSFADTAITYAQDGLRLAQKLNYEEGRDWCMIRLCGALTTLGNYAEAMVFGFKALSLSKEIKDTAALGFTYSSLAVCYREQGDYTKAAKFIMEDLRLLELRGLNPNVSEAVLSSIYERDNKLDSALYYAQRSYDLNKEWSGLLTVLGAIQSKLGQHELALGYYKMAIPFAIRDNFQIDILDAYNGIAQIYLNEGKTDSAIYYAKLSLIQKWGKAYPLGLLNASNLIADIYESKNKTDSTLKYLKLSISLKDSLFSREKNRTAQNVAFNEELHQQELQQKLEQSESAYRNRLNLYTLVAGLLILLIVALGLWRRDVFRKKSFLKLQKQHEQIKTTLNQLKATQFQLVQSEKMASLGELTAGIAHEIQNPLNFVNNFSEVNTELIDESIKAIDSGNQKEAKELLGNLRQNEEKVKFHGQRADAIVKGMLQHSRNTTGQKEPTDINALSDEYQRLSYYGLRAKDKSFNATMNTYFDPTIGKINIVPQDIGRVLLNLYNNAFYAVSEKKKQSLAGYEPSVSVSTKKVNDKVEIRIKDNGSGISQKVLDKIFQPFFTTKPAGQGTGLGLSMSYDIIKAHGGEIKVETRESEGSEFIIIIPS